MSPSTDLAAPSPVSSASTPPPAPDPRLLHGGIRWRLKLVREGSSAWLPPAFGCAADIHRHAQRYFRHLPQEEFWVFSCDVKNRGRGAFMVSRGILDASLVHPREVFQFAVATSAASIVLAHNHPSGDPEPSPQDRELTARLVEAGELLGVPVLDHVVIGAPGYVSFAERGWL